MANLENQVIRRIFQELIQNSGGVWVRSTVYDKIMGVSWITKYGVESRFYYNKGDGRLSTKWIGPINRRSIIWKLEDPDLSPLEDLIDYWSEQTKPIRRSRMKRETFLAFISSILIMIGFGFVFTSIYLADQANNFGGVPTYLMFGACLIMGTSLIFLNQATKEKNR